MNDVESNREKGPLLNTLCMCVFYTTYRDAGMHALALGYICMCMFYTTYALALGYICARIRTHTHIYTCTHTYTHTQTHTHTHTHTHAMRTHTPSVSDTVVFFKVKVLACC